MAEYQPRTDAEIKEIALGLMAGSIFCDRHLKDQPHMLSHVFMPAALMDEEGRKEMVEILFPEGEDGEVGMVYEWMDQAGPRAVNGLPMFMSFRLLSPGDVARVDEVIKRLEAV